MPVSKIWQAFVLVKAIANVYSRKRNLYTVQEIRHNLMEYKRALAQYSKCFKNVDNGLLKYKD